MVFAISGIMLPPMENVTFLKIALLHCSEIVLSPMEINIIENRCFRNLINRVPNNGNNNILENHSFALLWNRALANGKEPILENSCFRNLRNRVLTNGNNNILGNCCFAILEFVFLRMEMALLLQIINFCFHTSFHAAFSKIVSSPIVRTRILYFELRA